MAHDHPPFRHRRRADRDRGHGSRCPRGRSAQPTTRAGGSTVTINLTSQTLTTIMQSIDLVLSLIAFAFVAVLGAAGAYDAVQQRRFQEKEPQ